MSTPIFPADGVTDTSFTFTALLPDTPGPYNVILKDVNGVELGREPAGITVTGVPAVITSLTPDTVMETTAATFTVTGTELASTDSVVLIEQTSSAETPLTPAGVTDTGFTFDWAAPVIGIYDVVLKDASDAETGRLDGGIEVVAVPTVATIFTITPQTEVESINITHAVTGWGLLPTERIKFGSSQTDVQNKTDTFFNFVTALSDGSYTVTLTTDTMGNNVFCTWDEQLVRTPAFISEVTPADPIADTSTDFSVVGDGFASFIGFVRFEPTSGGTDIDSPITGTVVRDLVTTTATLPAGTYHVSLWDYSKATEVARLDNAVSTAVPPTITSVDPSTSFPESTVFTVTGTGLAETTQVGRRPNGTADPWEFFPVTGATDTGFTTTQWWGVDVYDVAAADAADAVIASLDAAITIEDFPPPGTITKVTPGTWVDGTAQTYTVVGTGLGATVSTGRRRNGETTWQVFPADNVTETGFTFDATLATAVLDVAALDTNGDELAVALSAINIVAVPTVPTIFDIQPSEVQPYTTTWFSVWGWLLDPVDCIGVDNQTTGSGTNWSGLDFTNTGLQPLPWEYSHSPGVWDWHLKQGGSGGTILVSKIAAVTSLPVTFDSVTPDTVAPGVSTQFTAHGGGLIYVGKVDIIDTAGTVVVADIPIDGELAANSTDIQFTAAISAVGSYKVKLKDYANMGESIELADAITVQDTPGVATITSVTPDTAEQSDSVPTTFTVVGTLLGDTVFGQVQEPDGNVLTPNAENVTDTGYTFICVLGQVGLHQVIAANYVYDEIARRADAITVTAPTPPPVFTSVTPTAVEATRASTFTVVGTSLAQLTAVSVVEQGVAVVPVTIANHTDTGFTFSWTPTSGQTGVYDLVGDGPDDDALLANAITVNPFVDTTPRIDTVSPASTWVNHMGLFVVTGYGLLEISEIRIGTSGVGFDDFGTSDFTVDTDTRIEFEGALTRIGLQDVIGNKQGGTAYLRKDDCLQVNSQLGRGTRHSVAELEIECGPAAQIVERLNELSIRPDVTEAWGADDRATLVCEDDSTVDVTWSGEVWVVWVVVIPGKAVLTRGETKSARELGIGRCAVTRKGTAQRLNNAGVEADPPENWGPGSCAYVLCNTGVHDDVRWDGTQWRECT